MDAFYAYWLSDDDTASKATNSQACSKMLREAAEKFGKSFEMVPLWREKMEKVGFVDVRESAFKVGIYIYFFFQNQF